MDWAQIGAGLTGIAAVAALLFTGLSLQETRQQNHVVEQGQITDRFSRAVQQLGDEDNLTVRLGGIYSLERISRDSDRDQYPAMKVVAAWLRENASLQECGDNTPADVHAAATVIGGRRVQFPIDLSGTCLPNIILEKSRFKSVQFSRSDLSGASLFVADLTGAYFDNADLSETNLNSANLYAAHLPRADLTNADLRKADLRRADFTEADLTNADLRGAYLKGTDFTRATLDGAKFSGGGPPS